MSRIEKIKWFGFYFLIPQIKQEVTGELVCNLSAAYYSAGMVEKAVNLYQKYASLAEDTFELEYNVACAYIESGNFPAALTHLEKAKGPEHVFFLYFTDN